MYFTKINSNNIFWRPLDLFGSSCVLGLGYHTNSCPLELCGSRGLEWSARESLLDLIEDYCCDRCRKKSKSLGGRNVVHWRPIDPFDSEYLYWTQMVYRGSYRGIFVMRD